MAYTLSEWGMAGVEALRDRVAVLVVVDVLSFSTAVEVAVSRGAAVIPFLHGDDDAARRAAERAGAVLARPRRAAGGQFSLSPASLLEIPAGTRLMLPSPNGSRLSLAGGGTPVLAGCLRNAAAVARAARGLAQGADIGVVPAGERWPDGGLRPAIEDLLGAGAVIDALALPCSPEAQVARDAWRSAGADLPRLVRDSVSGRELVDGGFPRDVDLALEQGVSSSAPLLVDGAYQAA
ncbi:MAG: 2-phosphosulfolactate phosphatase [Inquilinus sp.]|uniref:2-phosphosulfolactate phosphatase n=1 Tax=Inquilinus sp. TaxID=1932117 RepID=UPI003F349914